MNTLNSQTDPTESSYLSTQIVLVLVGLVASGKSTFAKALEEHNLRFRRCNQDDLGNRRAVENLARHSLHQGFSVCIDRTNIDEIQRAHWINIAREVPGTQVWCLVFDTPRHICAARLHTRTDHPTITSPELGLRILDGFANDLRVPSPNEGFDRIFYLKPSDHASPSYSADEINSILKRIGDSGDPVGGDNPSGQLSRQRDFMSNYVTRGGRGEWRPQRRGRSSFGRGGGRGSGRSRPYHTHNADAHRREWSYGAPIRRQSPHSQTSPRINDHEGRAATASSESTNASASGSGSGAVDSPIIIS